MKKYNTKIGRIKYHYNYFIENFKQSFKLAFEYKANLFSSLFENTIYFLITILFGYVLFESTFQIPSFGFKEFLLLAFIFNFQNDLMGLFWYGSFSSLDNLIKRGDLNLYFTKPMNKFLGYLFLKRFNPTAFIIYDLILYIPLLSYYFDFKLLSVIFGVILILLLAIFGILFIQFLVSFTWHFLEAKRILLYELYFNGIQHNVGRFPMLFFQKNNFIIIPLSGFSFYYLSMWIIPLLTTNTFTIQTYEIIMLLSVSLISILGIYINWTIGLKKYEAYG